MGPGSPVEAGAGVLASSPVAVFGFFRLHVSHTGLPLPCPEATVFEQEVVSTG